MSLDKYKVLFNRQDSTPGKWTYESLYKAVHHNINVIIAKSIVKCL